MKKYQVESTDGGQIAVYEYGNISGREIVFLHGFAADHHVWFQQYTDDRMILSHRIICVDLRGHGQSLLPDSDFSNNDLWADDLASILEQRKIKQPFIVAWSYGGRVINDYLLKYGQNNIQIMTNDSLRYVFVYRGLALRVEEKIKKFVEIIKNQINAICMGLKLL